MKPGILTWVVCLTLLSTAIPARAAELTELTINTYNYPPFGSTNPTIVSNVFTSSDFYFLHGTHFSNDFFLWAETSALGPVVASVDFQAPNGAALQPGTYTNATRWPFNPAGTPGLDYTIGSYGPNTISGQFNVLEAIYDANGVIEHFGATFEDISPTAGALLVTGTAYYNFDLPLSNVPEPGTMSLAAASLLAALYAIRRVSNPG